MRAKLFVSFLLAYILGAILAPLFAPSFDSFIALGIILTITSALVFRRRFVFAVIISLGIFSISIGLFQLKEYRLVNLNNDISGIEQEVVGFISDIPIENEYGQVLEITLDQNGVIEPSTKLKVYTDYYPKYNYAEKIMFRGKIKEYGEKKWRLAKDGFAGEVSVEGIEKLGEKTDSIIFIKKGLFTIRKSLNNILSASLPSPESGLASGLLLGEKAFLSKEMTQNLQNSGTTHIIALSGYNITIILGLFVVFERKWSKKMRLLVPIAFITIFVIMTGGSASLVRAAIMGSMPLIAKYLGRESDGFVAILFSAAVMIIFNPLIALFDVGFQLSFAALAGMIYLSPLIQKLFLRMPKYIASPLAETTGAQLAALPLLSYYFGTVSYISPFSNLVILMLIPLCMLVSFSIGLAGLIWQPLALILAIPGYPFLRSIAALTSFFGSLPISSGQLKVESPLWIFIAYLILFSMWLILGGKQRNLSSTMET